METTTLDKLLLWLKESIDEIGDGRFLPGETHGTMRSISHSDHESGEAVYYNVL